MTVSLSLSVKEEGVGVEGGRREEEEGVGLRERRGEVSA